MTLGSTYYVCITVKKVYKSGGSFIENAQVSVGRAKYR
jgi:hypothetical protein